MGDLRISLELSIYVKIKCGVNTFKVNVIFLALLLFQIEGTAIMPTRILIRKVRKHNRERISRIQVLNVVISVHLNTRRNRNSVFKLFIDLKVLNMIKLFDLPYTIERHKTRACCAVLNTMLGSDDVFFSERNIVASMRSSAYAFESFVLFHLISPF